MAYDDDSLTFEQALGRRRKLSLLLESTQAIIALSVTGVTLYVAMRLALSPDGSGTVASSLLLSNAFFLVIGYYFGRSNPKPGQRATDVDPNLKGTGASEHQG